MSGIETREYYRDDEVDLVAIDVGGHTIQVSERDGQPHLYVHDHATIRIEGEHKDGVRVVVGRDEFPTDIIPLSEYEFQQRYHHEP